MSLFNSINIDSSQPEMQSLDCFDSMLSLISSGPEYFQSHLIYPEFSSAHHPHPEILSSKKIFSCLDCEKNFTRQSFLNKHKTSHPQEKPLVCEICKKVFSLKGNLKVHSRVHTGEKPFECKTCFARFSTNGHLKDHNTSHLNLRTFLCFCGKIFLRKTTLKRHQFVHGGEKPHKCQVCGKRFSDVSNLNAHLRTHNGNRPFICEVSGCGKSFKTKAQMKGHMTSKSHGRGLILTGNNEESN